MKSSNIFLDIITLDSDHKLFSVHVSMMEKRHEMLSKCDFVFLYCFISKRRKLKISFVVYVKATEITAVSLIEHQFVYFYKCLWSSF